MSKHAKVPPPKGLMIFMWIYKIIVLFEGILLLALTGLYFLGIYSYQNKTMPLDFLPGNNIVPYWPVPTMQAGDSTATGTFSNQSFYYQKSDRSQFALGALTVLHALLTMLTACCSGKSLRRAGIVWTIGGLFNAITSGITVALTFSENNSSGRQFPTASMSDPSYWIYGKYSIEEWTCGDGNDFVSLQQGSNGPLGGQNAVNDFNKYCKESKGSKWLCVLILLCSVFLLFMGIFSIFRARSMRRQMEQGGPQGAYSNQPIAYGGAPPATDKLESFSSSGADSDAAPYAEPKPTQAQGLHPY